MEVKKIQQEDVDKILRTIEESKPVFVDVDKALEDGNFNWLTEGGPILVKHGGKALRLVQSAREIGREIADLDGDEAEVVLNAFAEAYAGDNSKKFEGAKHIVKGLAEIRTGIIILVEEDEE